MLRPGTSNLPPTSIAPDALYAPHPAAGWARRGSARRLPRPVALASLFALLATLYSLVTPVGESYDELGHFAYAHWIAATGTLPGRGDLKVPWAEDRQPPPYYLLAALPVAALGAPPLAQPPPNPFFYRLDGQAGFNSALHAEGEAWPVEPWVLAWRLARFTSVLLGALSILFVYLLARVVFGDAQPATTAALIAAFTPTLIFMSGVVNNDVALALATTAVLVQVARLAAGHTFGLRSASLLGASLGLALLTKGQAFALIPFVAWGTFIAALGRGQARRALLLLLYGYALAALAVSWALPRTLASYQTVLGIPLARIREGLTVAARLWPTVSTPLVALAGLFLLYTLVYALLQVLRRRSSAGRGPTLPSPWLLLHLALAVATTIAGLVAEPRLVTQLVANPRALEPLAEQSYRLFTSYWAAFGWGNVVLEDRVYAGYLGLVVLGLLGLLLALLRRGVPGPAARLLAVLLVYTLLLGGLPILFRWYGDALLGRYLLPLVGPLSVAFASGWHELGRIRLLRPLPYAVLLALAAVAVATPFRTIAPAYALPPRFERADQVAIPNRVDVTFGERILLLGYDLTPERLGADDRLELTLYFQALRSIDRDDVLFVAVGSPTPDSAEGRTLLRTHPGRGMYQTSRWRVGEVVVDRYRLPIAPDASADRLWRVLVGFEGLAAADARGVDLGPAAPLGLISVDAPATAPPPEVALGQPVTFGGALQLAGLEATASVPEVHLRAWWRLLAPPPAGLATLLHLATSPTDPPVATGDRPPLLGTLPGPLWQPGDLVQDDYRLSVPPGLPPGDYLLLLGLYDRASGQRLPALRADGSPLEASAAVVGRIRATPEGLRLLAVEPHEAATAHP